MSLVTVPQPILVPEATIIHCNCLRRRNPFRAGIRVAAVAGMIYAGYVAYQRNLFQFENVSTAITWFADRLRSEVETQKRLDVLSSQLKAAEMRATQLQRSLDKLTRVCGREPTARVPAAPPKGAVFWPFPGGQ